MGLVVFQHHRDETAGVLGTILQAHGHRLHTVELFNADADGDSVPADFPTDLDGVDGLVAMGGPMNVDEAGRYGWVQREMQLIASAHEASVPVVGICLGAQLAACALGGKVAPMQSPEVGFENVKLAFPGTTDPVLAGIPWNCLQFHLHGQEVTDLPPGATVLAGSAACKAQAFKVGFTTYAFQYHFEWDDAAIEHFSQDGLISRSQSSAPQIADQCRRHYHLYRHMGDRLCENITRLLFGADRH